MSDVFRYVFFVSFAIGTGNGVIYPFLTGTLSQQSFVTWTYLNTNSCFSPINPFTTGNPFLGTKLLGFSIGRGSGALKGLTRIIKSVVIGQAPVTSGAEEYPREKTQ